MSKNPRRRRKMASEQTGRDAVDQLQEIRNEVAQVKGLSKFTARLLIDDAKNRKIDHVDKILKKFTVGRAKVYLLVDGFRSNAQIGRDVGIPPQNSHRHLERLIEDGFIDRDDSGSSKATFRKSSVEDVIRLSNLLKKKFDLNEWIDNVRSRDDR